MTDHEVEDLKALAERITPPKSQGNTDALDDMDKEGCTPREKVLMLLGSMLDYIKYGN